MFGEQQQTTFETFDETSSMQAGERFERDTKPVHPYDKPLPPGARERYVGGEVEIGDEEKDKARDEIRDE